MSSFAIAPSFSVRELETACYSLSNLLKAGLSLKDSLTRMPKIQVRFADFWLSCAEQVGRGAIFSSMLYGVWPEYLISALSAGEKSGRIQQVLERQAQALGAKLALRKLFGQILSPLFALGLGLLVFLFIMLEVIPKMAQALEGPQNSFAMQVSNTLTWALYENGLWVALGAIGLGVWGTFWLKNADNRLRVLELVSKNVLFDTAFRQLSFSTAAKMMATLDCAGLPIKHQFLLVAQTVPAIYQSGFLLAAQEVERRGRDGAVDPELQDEGDPRKDWPYFFSIAVMNSHETGELATEMDRISPILYAEGEKRMKQLIAVADIVAKLSAALMIGLPMLAYFAQLSDTLTQAFA